MWAARWRAAALAVFASTGCGRVGFATQLDARTDGPTSHMDTAAALVPVVVATVQQGLIMAMNIGFMITPTTPGDALIVAITQETSANTTVANVSTQGSTIATFQSANERSVDTQCDKTAEIWYLADATGADGVSIAMSADAAIETWVLEVKNLSTIPFKNGNGASTQPSTTSIETPSIAVNTNNLIVTTAASCGGIQSYDSGGFTALPIENGEDTAYRIATTTGSVNVEWNATAGSWNASTAVFR